MKKVIFLIKIYFIQCLGHSWYLSVDMQLFILSPLIIFPLWKWGKHVLWLVAALILSSVIYVFVVFLVNEFTNKILDEGYDLYVILIIIILINN